MRDTLYLFLSELKTYRRQAGSDTSDVPTRLKHLNLLIGKAYKTTTERLVPLLKHSEITFDLIWALFKPNDLLYTTCFDTMSDLPMFLRPLARFHWVFLTSKQLSKPMDHPFQI